MQIHRPARAYIGALLAFCVLITVVFDRPIGHVTLIVLIFASVAAASLLRQSVIPKKPKGP